MKIGIIAYRQYPYISANTEIAYLIGEQLNQDDNFEVVFIGLRQDASQPDFYHDIYICYFNDIYKNKFKGILKKTLDHVCVRFRLVNEIRGLKNIVNDEKIDALICMIAPIDNAFIAYFSNLNIPIYLYQLDPFYNVMDKENSRLKKQFIKMLDKFNHTFTTELLYDIYYQDESFSKYMNKISVLQFPKLTDKTATMSTHEKSSSIKLLYAGTLYTDIRSPKILEDLKLRLQGNKEIVFCGNCTDSTYIKILEENGVICKGYCSQEVLIKEVQKADVLINIGNSVKNQLGSKIVDYIGTGKPILNIVQFDDCPTKRLLKKYNNHYSLSVEQLYAGLYIDELNTFIENAIGKQLGWNEIKGKYLEYTPEFVANKIKEILHNKKGVD